MTLILKSLLPIVLLLLVFSIPRRLGMRFPRVAFRPIIEALVRALWWVFYGVPTSLIRAMGTWWGDRATTIRCVNGCKKKLPAVAVVTCRACRYRSRRNVFAPCPACGVTRKHIHCPRCRMSIPRRALWTLPQLPRSYR